MMYRLDTTGSYSSLAWFCDVSPEMQDAAAITYRADRGWVNGYPDGSFRPGGYITRAKAVAVVNRMMGRTILSSNVS